MICLLSVLTLCLAVSVICTPVTAQAAAKKGLVKKGSNYYYYKKGKKITNKWKKIKQDGVKYKFYFGKKGKAYKAKSLTNKAYNVKLFKIKGKKYGFDNKARRVIVDASAGKAAGVYVDNKNKIYVFNKKGIYDSKASKALRKTFGSYRSTKVKSKTLRDDVIKAFGEPLQEKMENCCSDVRWNDDPYQDVILTYKYFEVDLVYNEKTQEYAVDNLWPVVV